MRVNILLFAIIAIFLPCFSHAAQGKRVVLPKDSTPLHYKLYIAPNADLLTFDGKSDIDLQVNKATSTVVLNSADLVFKSATIQGHGPALVTFDKVRETATLKFSKALKPGAYTVSIEYSGKIFKSASGLFALDYVVGGSTKRGLYTQLENSDARRVFPCFDEPGIKATFELSAKVPAAQMAVSNTPVVDTKTEGAMKTVRFARTPKMSTYLLFFGLGDFERVTRVVNGVEIGIVVKRGDIAKAAFALDTASQLLPYFEDYFGVKYPLPKLDLVAAPGTSQFFSAMENWGAIFYFDRAILVDPRISTEGDKRYVYLVIAHEMAHQWFGNLVTMAWWDDLWLNEGFANWMETNATNQFHPEWRPWLIMRNGTSDAMQLDAKLGTHPIVQPILDVLQASQAFDKITYEKGSAVIRMIEAYVGPDAFRAGLRSYMKKYAYKNTVSDDLWREIDANSSRKVTGIAHDFTFKTGVPLIDVKTTKNGWQLKQSVFSVDGSTKPNQSWQVPVDATRLGNTVSFKGIVSASKPALIANEKAGSLIVDTQLSGYYLTRLDEKAFSALLSDFDKLSVETQFGLVSDSSNLGLTGFSPISRILVLAELMTPKLNHLVLTSLVNQLSYIDRFYTDLPTQALFREFAIKRIRPILDQIGWTSQPADNADTPELRTSVIRTLGKMGDRDVVAKANTYYETFLKDMNSLPAELRTSVLEVVARHASEPQWRQIHTLALKAPSVVERNQYYALLTSTTNADLAKKALELAISKDTPSTVGPDLIRGIANRFPRLALDFIIANVAWLNEQLEFTSRTVYVPSLLAGSFDRGLIPTLKAYAQKEIPKNAMQSVNKTVSSIQLNAKIREMRIPEIDAWLKSKR